MRPVQCHNIRPVKKLPPDGALFIARQAPCQLKGVDNYSFSVLVLLRLVWVLRGLDEQHFASELLIEQSCKLLCALADLLNVLLAPEESRPPSSSNSSSSSSRVRQGPDKTFSWFLELDRKAQQHGMRIDSCCEMVMRTLAQTVRTLNQHVFQRATFAPPQLVLTATLCCKRMASMLLSWETEVEDHGTVEQCEVLARWCIDFDLMYHLAEAMVLVLGMDPASYLARGPEGAVQLTNTVLMAMGAANSLQGYAICAENHLQEHSPRKLDRTPLLAGAQCSAEDDTAPAPFVRLVLLWLAIKQHWRRAAALPPGSMPYQSRGSPAAVSALRSALQQQLTPSCCTQLVQRVAPAYWAMVTAKRVPHNEQERVTLDRGDLCAKDIGYWLQTLAGTVDKYKTEPSYAIGAQELQLVMECAELHAATTDEQFALWHSLGFALAACPYPALVEFATHHGRTLLTLAERSLEAGLSAAAAAAAGGGGSSGRGSQAGGAAMDRHLHAAMMLAGCLSCCLEGGVQGRHLGQNASAIDPAGYPADATWALLGPSTAPRLLRLMEALLRNPSTPGSPSINMYVLLPGHLPEMALFYSRPSTVRATLSAVTSLIKALQGGIVAVEMMMQHPTNKAAAAAAIAAAVPWVTERALSAEYLQYDHLWLSTLGLSRDIAELAVQHLGRAALLLDPEPYTATIAAAATAAAAAGPRLGRDSRVWVQETALLGGQPDSLAAYKTLVKACPQRVGGNSERFQRCVAAMHQAAAARQADQLAKQSGADAAALAEQLQALHLGSGTSSMGGDSGDATAAATAAAATRKRVQAGASGGVASTAGRSGSSSSSSAASSAGGVPPGTPGDITVAANALLVACKAAGALAGVPQLLQQALETFIAHRAVPTDPEHLAVFKERTERLSAVLLDLAEWAVLLHPVLVQLLPAEHGQVLVGLHRRLVGSSSSSSSTAGAAQGGRGSIGSLSTEEVAAVLGALQQVVIPGQPGCSNPRCCSLQGVSEGEMKTQVCVGCRGARYCSTACQRAHWRAGHKEVCKAVQAAAKAAAAGGVAGAS